ncbi:MAG TPA: hypothetical protein VL117_15445, partial [Thermoleophilia bacterium]|nr:hypothetical protein [Thermoleophilia bacterium]
MASRVTPPRPVPIRRRPPHEEVVESRREPGRRDASGRRLFFVLVPALLVAAALGALAPVAAAQTPTSLSSQGVVGTPFSFVPPLGPGMSVIGDADQSLAFQLSAADLSGLSGDSQVTAVASSGALDLLLPSGLPATRKDFDTIGGTLELGAIRDVSIALYYNVDSRLTGGELLWQLAGFPETGLAADGTFTLALPDGTNGTTIAYQIRITAPAVVMATPVTIDDITLGYGVYTKPKPSHKAAHKPSPKTSSGTSSGAAPAGNDASQSGVQTGNGSGTGAGNGSGAGNVSGGSVVHPRSASPPV